jgi:hypothetical protein
VPGANSAGTEAIMLTQTGNTYYNDYATAAGVVYRYSVKAANTLSSSKFETDTGWRNIMTSSAESGAVTDYDGDRLSDLALFNSSSGVLDVLCSTLGRQTFVLGVDGSQGITGDYDGDRRADPTVYQQTGTWLAKLSSAGYNPISRVFGGNGDGPVAADFDGDRRTDVGVYNATNGALSVILSNGGGFDMRAECLIGGTGYRFVSADFDGDGKADPAVYSESEGRVTIMFSGKGYSSVNVMFGGPGKSMSSGDFDGDGKADPVLYDPSPGSGQAGRWTVLLSSAGYVGAHILFGGPGYAPAIGDYDGDGRSDPAIYSESTGQWQIMFSGSGYAVLAETFGGANFKPLGK